MNVIETIHQRISHRNYDPSKKVSDEILQQILEAGRVAPSACNLQPWKFTIVTGEEKLNAVKESYTRAWFQKVPMVLVVSGKPQDAWTREDGYNSLETDLTIAMDHMILTAESLNVSTCWIAAFNAEKLYNALCFPDDEVIFAMTPLGYTDPNVTEGQQKQRKSISSIVRYM